MCLQFRASRQSQTALTGTDAPAHASDHPITAELRRYARFLWGVVRFDPGQTAVRSRVAAQLGPAIPSTLRLIVAAVGIQLVLGITGGAWSAWRRRGVAVWLVTTVAFVSLSVPVFVSGTLAQCLLTNRTSGFTCAGTPEGPLAFWIPAMLLALSALAGTLRLVRATVGGSLRSGPGQLADALGIGPRRLVGMHALRPALVPVVELLAAQFSTLFTGAVILEVVFDRVGIGQTLFAALRGREVVLAASIVTSVSVSVVLATLTADVLAALLDPRLRRAR